MITHNILGLVIINTEKMYELYNKTHLPFIRLLIPHNYALIFRSPVRGLIKRRKFFTGEMYIKQS